MAAPLKISNFLNFQAVIPSPPAWLVARWMVASKVRQGTVAKVIRSQLVTVSWDQGLEPHGDAITAVFPAHFFQRDLDGLGNLILNYNHVAEFRYVYIYIYYVCVYIYYIYIRCKRMVC